MKAGHSNRIKKIVIRDIFIVLVGMLYWLFVKKTGFAIPCVFYTITGYKCPGCGITHSIMALTGGHLRTAFECNPFLWIAGPVIIYLLIKGDIRFIKYDTFELNKADTIITYICVVLAVIYWFVRNI
jgi:hypothetical protein